MFGLSATEIALYRDLAHQHAVNRVTPVIMKEAEVMAPLLNVGKGGKQIPDLGHVNRVVADIESIITLTTVHVAYEYAHRQESSTDDEYKIIENLHRDYETYLIDQFINYGISFRTKTISRILGEIILELPYMYSATIEDEEFNPDLYLEENMEAYEKYLGDNFPDFVGDEEDEENDE